MTVRVLLVDDQSLVRAGLRALLDRAGDLEVVGEAEDGAAAVAAVRALHPDVVLMDIRMPVLDGLAATREIVANPALSAVRIVVLTTYEVDDYVFEALRVGASGFLLKDTDPEDLRRAVRVVADGDALLSPRVTRRLITEVTRRPGRPTADPAQLDALTDREREVMSLVAGGLSNLEIGRELHLSPATVKTHVNRAMMKLDARDRAQLVVLAYQCGLVTP